MQIYRKVYKPHACELRPFSAEQFEACLPGKRVIIIGDSTMRQMFQSLACLMTPVISAGEFLVREPSFPLHACMHALSALSGPLRHA